MHQESVQKLELASIGLDSSGMDSKRDRLGNETTTILILERRILKF